MDTDNGKVISPEINDVSLDSNNDVKSVDRMTSIVSISSLESLNMDAVNYSPPANDDATEIGLINSINEALRCVELFMNNKFHEATELGQKHAHDSLYHACITGLLKFLNGILSLEKPDIESGLEALKQGIAISYKLKKDHGLMGNLSNMVWRPNYDDYTDMEIHAELCYGEMQLLYSILTFFGDQSFLTLIKGAFRLRSSNQIFKECDHILKNRKNWSSPESLMHFKSGVIFGVGIFNLFLSNLPSRVLRILEVAGFSGDLKLSMKYLNSLQETKESMRYIIGACTYAAYNLYLEQIFGTGMGDLKLTKSLLDDVYSKHSNSAFILFMYAKLTQVQGDLKKAITLFKKCLEIQDEWKQVHNICYWDLIWCHSLLGNWEDASNYAQNLTDNCKWCPAVNSHQVACFLYMKYEQDGCKSNELKQKITHAMSQVPQLRQKYAGKTLPIEKFAVVKAQHFFDSGERLPVPAYELLYHYNIFNHANGNKDILGPVIEKLDAEYSKLTKFDSDSQIEDLALILLLRGVCYRCLDKNSLAIECFEEIIDMADNLESNNYIPPYACLEMGITYFKIGEHEKAKLWLEKARNNYSGFLIESMLHIRVHGALRELKIKLKKLDSIDFKENVNLKEIDVTKKRSLSNWFGIKQ